ncbi:hypothetical protein IZY60_01755 [Lutibacter sp. B2]|nr:hypothetical protein [Lutibacter sp. B2]
MFLKILFSFIFGVFLIIYMVSFGMIERYITIVFTIFIYLLIKNIKKMNMKSIGIILVSIVVGMSVTSYSLFYFEYKSDHTDLQKSFEPKKNTAVLLVFEGEPAKYDLSILLKNIEKDKMYKYIFTTPFHLYKVKRTYEEMGNSGYEEMCNNIYLKLSNRLDEGYDIFLGYANNKLYYQDVIDKKIVKNNYKRIIVVPVTLTESKVYHRIVNDITLKKTHLKEIEFEFCDPLWNNKNIENSIVRRIINRKEGIDKEKIGIILLGEAFKEGSDKDNLLKNMKQEKIVIDHIKLKLKENEFEERKILYANTYLNELQVKNFLEQLQSYGVEKFFIVNTGDIVDTIKNQYIIKKIVEHTKNMEGIDVCYIKGWGEDDLLIETLEFKIRSMNVKIWSSSN